jgi:hypothetical protein
MDGKEMLSKEVSLRVDNQFAIDMYPNPTVAEAVFENNLDQDYEMSVSVYDNEGRFVMNIMKNTFIEKGQFRQEFSINDLAAGVYNVVFKIGNDKIERRLIKMSI